MEEEAYKALQEGFLQSFTWKKGLIALTIFLAFLLGATLAGRLARRGFARLGSEGGSAFALSKLLTYFLKFAGLLTALGLLGLPLGSLLLTSSALLVGLGFSMQHVARDFVSSLILLVEQSVRKDDFVTFGEITGRVLVIGLRSTQLLQQDGTVLVVPNHLLTSTEVENHSSPLRRARVDVTVPVGFIENVELVKETLLQVARPHEHVLAEPAPAVFFEAITESHLEFRLMAWVDDPGLTLLIGSELRFAIAQAFAKSGIQFPTPELALRSLDQGSGLRRMPARSD